MLLLFSFVHVAYQAFVILICVFLSTVISKKCIVNFYQEAGVIKNIYT
jgi:hypothetical protein